MAGQQEQGTLHVPATTKRKLQLEELDPWPHGRPGKRRTDKENGPPNSQASTVVPQRKRESRLKKLRSSKALAGHTPADASAPPASLLAPVQGVALPPPLDLDRLLEERGRGDSSSDETLKQLADIIARKRRRKPLQGSTTVSGRPSKKARSLCGAEAAKFISRRQAAEGDDGQEEGARVAGDEENGDVASCQASGTLQVARAALEMESIAMVARSVAPVGEELIVPLVPLWDELQRRRQPTSAVPAAPACDSPDDQSERRRRRSRSVGDLKQLMAAAEGATAAQQCAVQPPKKRERRRKRNSLVRAIDKLISVTGMAGAPKDEETNSAIPTDVPDGHGGAQDVDHEERPTERVQEHGHDQPEDCPPDDATVDVSLHGGTLPEYVDACQLLRVTFWLTTLNRIFRYVVVSNWKSRAEAALRDPIGDTRCMIWKDRSLVLNFLFGMRRWKVSPHDLFLLLLEEYHFGAGAHVMEHIDRDLEQEKKNMRSLRQKLAALVHVWVLYFYKSEKEKRFLGRFLELLKRDGLLEEVKEIQVKIWNACQEQDKLQAIQKLTPKRRPAPATMAASPMASPLVSRIGSQTTQNPIYSASPSSRRPPSTMRPSSSVVPKGGISTPSRTPLRAGRGPVVPQTLPKTPTASSSSFAVVSMLTLSTTAVAKQLSRIEYDLFRAVPASEFMDICKSNVPRPSLSRLVEHTNKISYWVATQIVTLSRNKDKVKMLYKLITLAEKCLRLRNFASSSAILIGLNLSLISRMKDVWEALPSKQMALFEKIKSIPMADANYRRLRTLVRREKVRLERLEMLSHHVKDVDPALLAVPSTDSESSPTPELTPPVIPFMAIYNKDFTFVEEQPNNYADGKINYDKMQLVGGLLREIHLFQHQLCSVDALDSDPVVENYLANITYLSEDTLWSLSGTHTALRS